MQQPAASPFKLLKIVHTTLMAGLAAFIVVSFVLVNQGLMGKDDKDLDLIFQVIAAVLSISMLLIGFSKFKKGLVEARNSPEPGEIRFDKYRAVCIVWWAMLEGPGLFSTICYLLVGNVAFLALAIFQLIILAAFMPRRDNIIVLLNLTTDEVRRLENPA
jgi:hypothetical protein